MKKIACACLLLVGLICSGSAVACTGFMAIDDTQVLMGNNEDWLYPDVNLRFYPAQADKHGRMYIECNYPLDTNPGYMSSFAGLNDQGLGFDIFLHPYLLPVNSSEKPDFPGDLMVYCLERCATVDEVLALFDQYNLEFMDDIQYLVVDGSGDSAIIEGDTIIHKQGSFQVVTNFLQSHPELGWYPCWRYETAVRMLENISELSVENFRDICSATHQEGLYPTIYSYVFDVNAGLIYLYHYYSYETVVMLNLSEELNQGAHSYYLPGLFEPEGNQPPRVPDRPNGPTTGKVRVECTYRSSSSDPESNTMYYLFDWGDGTTSNWVKQQADGEGVATHTWMLRGTYQVKVKTMDIYGKQSDWSEPLPITMPHSFLFEGRFPLLERVLEVFRVLFDSLTAMIMPSSH